MTKTNSRWTQPRVVIPLLSFILLAGFALRTWNVNFDRGIGSHPDERSTACFYATTIALPGSWETLRDPRQSPLNPLWDQARQERRSFTYGHFPLYLGVAAGEAMQRLAPLATQVGVPDEMTALMARAGSACDAIAVAGRLTIALLDTFTILLLFFLTAAIFGSGAGLLAAAFYAFAAQSIQLSHFFAMDPASTTFTVMAVWGAVRMVQRRTWGAALLAGAGAGLAIASKFSALPILAAPVVAAIIIFWQTAQQEALSAAGRPLPGSGQVRFRALGGALLALGVAALTFLITSPYAVLDWQNFIQATLVEQGRMVRGVADMPFTRQYRNTTPYLYFIEQQLLWGLGLPLGLVALAGTLFAAAGLVRTLYGMFATLLGRLTGRVFWYEIPERELLLLVIWSWIVPYFGLTGAFLAKFNRYMSPILPFVLLFAAGLIWHLWHGRLFGVRRLDGLSSAAFPAGFPPTVETTEGTVSTMDDPRPRVFLRHALAIGLAVIGIGGGLFWSVAYVNGVYNREHTWITASRWMYENIPAGSTILWELWDDPLPKAIPDEAGMDMGSAGLRNIDWSPYEEDTEEKYLRMRDALGAADYVAYSSKRIYDSVDELPERYPMTNLYYEHMFAGRLGFELVAEFTSPPRLLGIEFDDRNADESWSLYDHPQVLVFEKVRELSDAEFDALFAGTWEEAQPWYRGKDSPLSPLLNVLGLGSDPGSEDAGLINRVIDVIGGEQQGAMEASARGPSLLLSQPLSQLPVVDDYRWNGFASERAGAATVLWWLLLAVMGWIAWPLLFGPLRALRDRGYFFARTLGWLLSAWLLWWLASLAWLQNTVRNAWLVLGMVALLGLLAAWRQRGALRSFLRNRWQLLLMGEGLFAAAYLFFILIRVANPDIWQPWFGGEKLMEFAFLNGILRSPTFPPVDPHFAGGYINYYYFGIYLVAYLIKLSGIYAEVAFNLAIPALFALTVLNAFGLAYSAVPAATRLHGMSELPDPTETEPAADGEADDGDGTHVVGIDEGTDWRDGLGQAMLAPLFVAFIGNLDGFAQVARSLAAASEWTFQSASQGMRTLVNAVGGVAAVAGGQTLPPFDFWAPSRVIPWTINEFPYWSFLFADLHPHMIGIPFALFFLALVLTLIKDSNVYGRGLWPWGAALLGLFALMLGTLASINLWELPTYALLGLAALLVSQYRHDGRVDWALTISASFVYMLGAYLAFAPFFRTFTSVGAGGIGFVREPDPSGLWLLIWGFLLFATVSWLFYTVSRPARPAWRQDPHDILPDKIKPSGVERLSSLAWRQFDRLPRLVYLHQLLVTRTTLGYQLSLWLLPIFLLAAILALVWGRTVLALCLPLLALAFVLLWRRGRAADGGAQFAVLLTTLGFGILAGTQLVYLKDFLQGGEYYRMNTLFKFFIQVWVVWAIAAAVGVPRIWRGLSAPAHQVEVEGVEQTHSSGQRVLAGSWRAAFLVLLVASLVYPVLGTPARVDQRFMGWRPPIGTLNGLDYMEEGVFAWPDGSHTIELAYDHDALIWLLDNIRGNAVIAESSQVDYYRAMGTRIASQSGLSGLNGMHEAEQRYGGDVAYRSERHREFWDAPDVARTQTLLSELKIDLIYFGQLERYLHPQAEAKFEQLVAQGQLERLYQNERTTIYAVPGRLQELAEGGYAPS
jgi:YYY domain-containing protein